MLTGELPGKPLQPPSKKVQIDVRLDEVVLRALEKNPELRYQQVSEVKTCVETIAATARSSDESAPASGSMPKTQEEPFAAGMRSDGGSSTATVKRKSELVRILEIMSGSAFTSPLVIKLINVSVLGFLASLGFCGFLPLPGMHRCFGFFGFSGFFGLIGFAFIVETSARSKGGSSSATQCRFVVVGRRGGKAVVNWPVFC